MKTEYMVAAILTALVVSAMAMWAKPKEDAAQQQPSIRMTPKGDIQIGTNSVVVSVQEVPDYLRRLGTPTNDMIVISCPPLSDAKKLEELQAAIRKAGWPLVITIIH